jgi:hypothetical protein
VIAAGAKVVHAVPADARQRPMRQMNSLDPNTHAYVVATAFFTSIAFMIFALNLLALVMQRVL